MLIRNSALPWSQIRTSHAELGVHKNGKSGPEVERRPRPKRASPKNMRDIAMGETFREHAHPLIENFDQAVMLYCGLLLGVQGERRAVEKYLYCHLRATAAQETTRTGDYVFTVEIAKVTAKAMYDDIARDILRIAEHGELQYGASDAAAYRLGPILNGPDKRVLVLRVELGDATRVLKVSTDQRFDKRLLPFARDLNKVKKPVQRTNKPKYINTSHMVA